jgi:hypothetical protein
MDDQPFIPLTIKRRPGSVRRILTQLPRIGSPLTTRLGLQISQSTVFPFPILGRMPR